MKMRISIKLLFISLCCIFTLVGGVFATTETADAAVLPYTFEVEWASLRPEDAASLTPPVETALPVPMAVLWLRPAQGYHTYAHSPEGDALPTQVALSDMAIAGVQVRYMPGAPQADVFDPSTIVNVYEGDTPIFVLFTEGLVADGARLEVSMLACSELNCFPVKRSVALPAVPAVLPDAGPWLALLGNSVPGTIKAVTSAPTSDTKLGEHAGLLPLDSGLTSVFSTMDGTNSQESGVTVALPGQGTPLPKIGGALDWDFAPIAFQASLEVRGMGKAVLFGLLAGLILNIMPCVLPVLTLKISTLLAAEGPLEERRRNFREHNLLFSAGILTWFAALALLCGLAGLAWGQIFQNGMVVFIMLLLVFCLGLSMFDVFHLPVLDLRVGNTSSPRVKAYSTGLLATLLATPCSGPLLGGVLGWSLSQSLPVLMTVFLATGIGMALPYLLMAWKPSIASLLPKPGAWMLTFERILGFFLMATGIYLFSILPSAMQIPALIVLLIAAMAAWTWGRWGSLRGTLRRRLCIGGGGLAAVVLGMYLGFAPAPAQIRWLPFQQESFQSMLGQKPLLVEFTADWCPTCKVLERTTLTANNLTPLIRQYGLTLVRVDMTRHDPVAQSLQRALDSASLPLLAIFPAGERAGEPVVLRDLYTPAQLRGAVSQAMQP